MSSRHLYSVPTVLLLDRSSDDTVVGQAVNDLGEKSASDGLESDDKGHVYAGDYEHDSIRQRQTDGEWKTIAHDPQILRPDRLSVAANGYLYFTVNQVERQPLFHEGIDLREKPYTNVAALGAFPEKTDQPVPVSFVWKYPHPSRCCGR